MVRLKVDVIFTHGTPGALAAKRATTTIPIVFATAGDAVASGLVTSLARPGGNVTGSTYFIPELSAKQLELLKELIPGLTDVGILLNPANPMNEPVVPAMKQTAQCERRTVRLRARFESSGRSWHTGFLHSLYARARLNGNLELSRRINIVRHSQTTT
jgi:ABC-type uncharacterized transport system substrate-binding protein